MINQIAGLEIAGADVEFYDALLGPGHAAGPLNVRVADRTRACFGTPDLDRTRARLARRGLELTDGGVLVNGLEIGLVSVAVAEPAGSADVVLDHLVVHVADSERAVASYGGRLGLDLRLEKHAPQWGMHMLFFRVGDDIFEVVQPLDMNAHLGPDALWGVTWRVRSIDETVERLARGGFALSDIRDGRKPGTRVCTVRDDRAGIPTLLIQQESLPFSRS